MIFVSFTSQGRKIDQD